MPQRLRRPRAEVESIIDRAIDEAETLLEAAGDVRDQASYESWLNDLHRWHARTREALQSSYEGDEVASEFYDAATGGRVLIWGGGESLDEIFDGRQKATREAINTLRSIRERLDYAEVPSAADEPIPAPEAAPLARRVFVVHGHDEGLREQVARVLDKLDFEPLILMEQPNKGRTLIEKFEDGALDVGFAVVLLTADDFCRDSDADEWSEQPNRARQNVVLELGYFMGKLGRPRVAALFQPGTEIPTDIHGLGYIEIDAGGAWRFELASELRAAGYDVDTNRL
jgi:predicted nucleotide-binding protein